MPDNNSERHHATCHCGAVRFSVPYDTDFSSAVRCDCSFCKRRFLPNAAVQESDLKIEDGKDSLSIYLWNTEVAKHYFCKHCGIYTFHQRRSNPQIYGVNIGCFDHLNVRDFSSTQIFDGVNHPSDRKE